MATEEFYIRNESDTEARGPFNFEQLSSLAENGQVTRETLYYDAGQENWVAVGADADLVAKLYPEKRKLTVKPKAKIASLNQASESAAPIEVGDMLAAAEGRTEDTRDKVDPVEAQARAAKIGMLGATVALLASALGLLLPAITIIVEGNYGALLTNPLTFLGVVDLVLFVLVLLGIASVYPVVRFRAALGAGFFGLVAWLQSDLTLLAAVLAGCVGLYFCTVLTRLGPVIVAVTLAAGGMGWFAYTAIIH
jgi:hypothetical protein